MFGCMGMGISCQRSLSRLQGARAVADRYTNQTEIGQGFISPGLPLLVLNGVVSGFSSQYFISSQDSEENETDTKALQCHSVRSKSTLKADSFF